MGQSNKFKEKINNLDIREFIDFYNTSSLIDTMKKYHMDQKTVRAILENNSVNTLNCSERGSLRHSQTIDNLKNQIPKELLYDLYITQGLSLLECQRRCGLTYTYISSTFIELFKVYNIQIRKSIETRKSSGEKHTQKVLQNLIQTIPRQQLEKDYIEYGRVYLEKKYHTQKILQLLDYYDIPKKNNNEFRASKVSRSAFERALKRISYDNLYIDWIEAKLPVPDMLRKYSISEKILCDILEYYGIGRKHPYRVATANSSYNQRFYDRLIAKGFDENFVAREYYVKNRFKRKFRFDFKVGDYLIEIDPFITHNSSKIFTKKYGVRDVYYHQLKSKIAFEHGLTCIHIFDWIDIDYVIDTILKGKIQLKIKDFEQPRKYIYNYKQNKLVKKEGGDTVIIYDDGAVYE